ncbi:zinc finger CCCH domain-containing protein 9-like [Salvia hispanica]|uniref:zinc finger CCCH domain-containing protein 9-like n=1 Tax=Salvia hispanica TaxID=49212 RepID=UPI00200971BC|nr:zinc finger CCCH domain-containing protein 9-like [Salvia hispanica]
MQREDVSYDSLLASSAADKSAAASLLFSFTNPFLPPTSPSYVNSDASFYSSLFQNHSSSTTSDTASFDGGDDADRRIQDASCVVEYQQLYNRYTLCLAQLHDAIEEADALRRDNDSLRLSNADLTHRIALLFSRGRLLSDFNRLNVASPSAAAAHLSLTQPLAELNRVERRSIERVTLPKSISVRTSGFLKMTRPGRDTTGDKVVSQPTPELREQQRVYVGGSTAENVEELDVYNQGMTKTELCNKWQETGACPYGENCQFAHGINELRPVIRHPRYKTEVCRMVLAGDVCPYGHRCHFRHSLTEEERLMVAPPQH